MKIETKYEIGQHIWVVSKINGGMPEVSVCDDYIEDIVIDKNGYTYAAGDIYTEYKEDEMQQKKFQKWKFCFISVDFQKDLRYIISIVL